FARADLGVAQLEDVPMIPEEAVLQRADGAVVFRLIDQSRVERRVIQTGVHRDGEVEVVEGLAPGDWVVIRGHYSLVDGVVVQPQGRDGSLLSLPLARAERNDESVP
ncbi:MAG: efflux transporter periplasmic adaptor subunit, partial [Myxococcota bacterium]